VLTSALVVVSEVVVAGVAVVVGGDVAVPQGDSRRVGRGWGMSGDEQGCVGDGTGCC
jgi:hypothetical protein